MFLYGGSTSSCLPMDFAFNTAICHSIEDYRKKGYKPSPSLFHQNLVQNLLSEETPPA